MPALDVLMIIIWLGMVFFGGTTGFLRQVLLLVAIYAAAILAGVGHPYLTSALGMLRLGVSNDLLNSYMFFFLFILVIGLLYVGFVSAFPETRPVAQGAHLVDSAAGSLLGALTGLMLIVGLYAAV